MSNVSNTFYYGQATLGTPTLAYTVPSTKAVLKSLLVSATPGPGNMPASLSYPYSLTVDGLGNIFFVDCATTAVGSGYCIRKLSSDGSLTTLAGNSTVSGTVDGIGFAARFSGINALVVDSTNTYLYCCENTGVIIRRITIATGQVTTIAGSGATGTADGNGTAATFSNPLAMCISPDGLTLFLVQGNIVNLRKIATTAPYAVTTMAAMPVGASRGICTDGTYLYVLGTGANSLMRQTIVGEAAISLVTLTGSSYQNGVTPGVNYTAVTGGAMGGHLALDTSNGNPRLYYADVGNHAVRVFDIQALSANYATVNVVANTVVGVGNNVLGSSLTGTGTDTGCNVNDFAPNARTSGPLGLTLRNGSLFISSFNGHGIQRLSLADGFCHAIAGAMVPGQSPITADGNAMAPGSIAYYNVYHVPNGGTLDLNKHCIRRSAPVGLGRTEITLLNKNLGNGDKLYLEACSPGMTFELTGTEIT
jgi:hypothetical protein